MTFFPIMMGPETTDRRPTPDSFLKRTCSLLPRCTFGSMSIRSPASANGRLQQTSAVSRDVVKERAGDGLEDEGHRMSPKVLVPARPT